MGDKSRAITTNTMEESFSSKLAGKTLSSGAPTAGRQNGELQLLFVTVEIETGLPEKVVANLNIGEFLI
ncbi:hypothetical protein RCL_jg17993.t1 [Rhizophagus clarus]|uniref:Uncharacterized protein n=1 Tax=Rhizophagus clarus TaxID=94130 RepID=A0A8H3QLP8_9GLOM|nr:hypothetical protein RCL_jg17993.t1 [Rhizophagus clarus]